MAVCMLLVSSLATADRVTTEDGVTCESREQDHPYELTTYAEATDNDYNENGYNDYYQDGDYNNYEIGVALSYKFGGEKSVTLDCTKLYDLALREKRLQLEELERKIKVHEAMISRNSKELKWEE